jgi:hypothetical protein
VFSGYTAVVFWLPEEKFIDLYLLSEEMAMELSVVIPALKKGL